MGYNSHMWVWLHALEVQHQAGISRSDGWRVCLHGFEAVWWDVGLPAYSMAVRCTLEMSHGAL
jgi:hypothetical protein